MKTENLIKLLDAANLWADDMELFNATADTDLEVRGWLFKHVVTFEKDVKDFPLYGSYLVTYHRDRMSFELLQDIFDNMINSSELFPYASLGCANIAKNTRFPFLGIFHIGCFADESLG